MVGGMVSMFTRCAREHAVDERPVRNGITVHRVSHAHAMSSEHTQDDDPLEYPRGLQLTFLAHAVVALGFALPWLLVPAGWASLVHWEPFDPAVTRLSGAMVMALAFSSWLAYRALTWEAVRIKTQLEVALTSFGALTGLYEVVLGGAPAFMWAPSVLLGMFAIAYGYYYRQARQRTPVGDTATA